MPTIAEHKKKYLENKDIVENMLDISKEGHRNWITTICFYAALHIIDMKLAEDNIHSTTHLSRENILIKMKKISPRVTVRYKQLSSLSRAARYDAGAISEKLTNQALTYLHDIEKEYELDKKDL